MGIFGRAGWVLHVLLFHLQGASGDRVPPLQPPPVQCRQGQLLHAAERRHFTPL